MELITASRCSFCDADLRAAKVIIWSPMRPAIGICDKCVAACVTTLVRSVLAYERDVPTQPRFDDAPATEPPATDAPHTPTRDGQTWPCGFTSDPAIMFEFCPRHGPTCPFKK